MEKVLPQLLFPDNDGVYPEGNGIKVPVETGLRSTDDLISFFFFHHKYVSSNRQSEIVLQIESDVWIPVKLAISGPKVDDGKFTGACNSCFTKMRNQQRVSKEFRQSLLSFFEDKVLPSIKESMKSNLIKYRKVFNENKSQIKILNKEKMKKYSDLKKYLD